MQTYDSFVAGIHPAAALSVKHMLSSVWQLKAALVPQNVEYIPPQKKARKELSTNWSTEEVMFLIQAKRSQQDKEENHVDKHILMLPDVNK